MTVRTLQSPPVLPLVLGRAVLTAVGRGGDTLPDTTLVLSDLHVDVEHLHRYARVCGCRLTDTLPVTYPHVLAFPLQMELMAERSFPFALPGLVHVRNVVVQRRALAAEEPLRLRVHAEGLRPHRAGRQFDLVTEVAAGGDTAWTGRATYLSRGKGDPEAAPEGPDVDVPATATATWRVPGDVGRRYAAVAGDVNPIHLHPLTAKAFGFPRTIAHGMWVKARVLASLEGRLPDTLTADAAFKKPLLVPSTVELASRRTDEGWDAVVRRPDGTPHLAMSVRGGS